MNSPLRWSTYAAPSRFYPLAGRLVPWFWAVTLAFTVAGLYVGLFVAPTDFQQGDAYRIIFIHVPAAWMSMLIYLVMAFWAAWGPASRSCCWPLPSTWACRRAASASTTRPWR